MWLENLIAGLWTANCTGIPIYQSVSADFWMPDSAVLEPLCTSSSSEMTGFIECSNEPGGGGGDVIDK